MHTCNLASVLFPGSVNHSRTLVEGAHAGVFAVVGVGLVLAFCLLQRMFQVHPLVIDASKMQDEVTYAPSRSSFQGF